MTDALARLGLMEAFDVAIGDGNRRDAVALLVTAGVDSETAADIVANVLPG